MTERSRSYKPIEEQAKEELEEEEFRRKVEETKRRMRDKDATRRRWAARWFFVWLVPFPIQVWYFKRVFFSVTIYQDQYINISMTRRNL